TPPPSIWVDGKPWKGDRAKIDGLSADEEHKIVLAADGYIPRTIVFTAKQGETKVVQDTLVRGDPNQKAEPQVAKGSDTPAGCSARGVSPAARPVRARRPRAPRTGSSR